MVMIKLIRDLCDFYKHFDEIDAAFMSDEWRMKWAAFSMATPVGCGTSGKASGIAASSIMKLGAYERSPAEIQI